MLRAEDAEAGRNFLTDGIREVAEKRIDEGGTVEPFRARHNMLSSMPMCFNLFGQLELRPELSRHFTETVVGEAIATATVKLEDSPEHLGDRTGVDASIRYETASGGRGILAIETKLTEQFSAKHYGLDHRSNYATYYSSAGNPFDQDRLEELTDTRWNQLWRNQMLAESVRVEEELEDAIQVVVYPERATDTAKLVAGYRDLLTRPDAVIDLTIEALLDRLQPHVAPADTRWLADFRTRYVDLHLSRPLYEAFRAGDQPFERGPE